MNRSRIIHNGFLGKLSYDIISNIFLYLDQQDCLNCMATCREWYDHLPQFIQDKWKTLHLNKKGVSQLQERNLGKHVKHVLFDGVPEDLLSKMMQKLLDCGCDEIESLEFISCISGATKKQQNRFSDLLRRLTPQQLTYLKKQQNIFLKQLNQLASHGLTHLKICNCKFSIIDLLSACPHLTHLTCQAEDNGGDDYKAVQPLPSDRISYTSLIYLHADVHLHTIKCQVRSIICKSPNLRYFIGASSRSYPEGSKILAPPEFVLEKCPKLEYYAGDGTYHRRGIAMYEVSYLLPAQATTKNNSKSGRGSLDQRQQQQQNSPFHHFDVLNIWDPNQIIFILSKNKDTSKYFRLGQMPLPGNHQFDWTHTFQTIALQQLRTFICDVHIYNKESIVTLLNTCHSTIQEVQLWNLGVQTLDVATLVRLQTLPQLRTLLMRSFNFADESSVVALLERLPLLENLTLNERKQFALPEQAVPLLKNLRCLTLEERYGLLERDEALALPPLVSPAFCTSLSQCESKLESVRLESYLDTGTPFSVLDALAALPSIKSLDVYGIDRYFAGELNEEKEEQHMVKFLNGLLRGPENNMNSSITTSLTTIKDLTLNRLHKLTYTILNALGNLTSLQNICISLVTLPYYSDDELLSTSEPGYLNLDLCGVLELLRKGRKLRKVVFKDVISFGEHQPSHYIQRKLVEQQKTNFRLLKYTVKPKFICAIADSALLFKSTIEIINLHYRQ